MASTRGKLISPSSGQDTPRLLTLTPDLEQALAAEARTLGMPPEQLALDSLRYQVALGHLRTTGRLVCHDLRITGANRMATLMAQYQDTPMD